MIMSELIHSPSEKASGVYMPKHSSKIAQICLNCPYPKKKCIGECEYYKKEYKRIRKCKQRK